MRLDAEFIRLPLALDIERLKYEAQQFGEADWDHHPLRFDGNAALALVSQGGQRTNATDGIMAPSIFLARCPYIKQLMAELKTVVGRSRLMRLAPSKTVPPHADTDYAWRHRVRIHIPIITDPKVTFSAIDKVDINMQAGEVWIFDNWNEHAVFNDSEIRRIHLVIDTMGTPEFWELTKAGWNPRTQQSLDNKSQSFDTWQQSIKELDFKHSDLEPIVAYEQNNIERVRPVAEVRDMLDELLFEVDGLEHKAPENYLKLCETCDALVRDWRMLLSHHGATLEAISHFHRRINTTKRQLKPLLLNVSLKTNKVDAMKVFSLWLDAMIDQNVSSSDAASAQISLSSGHSVATKLGSASLQFDRPIFIIGAPRSGMGMIFEALCQNHALWSLGDDMRNEIEFIDAFNPAKNGFKSNRLSGHDVTEEIAQSIKTKISQRIRNSRSLSLAEIDESHQPSSIRFLDKTVKNALRIPFLQAIFPDAFFVLMSRKPQSTVASLIEAWESGSFVSYQNLPNWPGLAWSSVLVDDWQTLIGSNVAEVAATQWLKVSLQIALDLQSVDASRVVHLRYEELLEAPALQIRRLCQRLDLPFGPRMQAFANDGLPFSKSVLSVPNDNKWRARSEQLDRVENILQKFEQPTFDKYS